MRHLPLTLSFLTVILLFSACAPDTPRYKPASPNSPNAQNQQAKQEQQHTVQRDRKPAQRRPKPAANWSRFRGPNGTGVSTVKGLPLKWTATENIVWRTQLPGPGSSSTITWGEHVYLTCYSGYGVDTKAPGNISDLKRHLVCCNRKDGKILWQKTIVSKTKETPYAGYICLHGYASSTPVADKAGIYVFFGTSGVVAYTHSGQQKWRTSCGTKFHGWGSGVAPLIYENLVIINAAVESASLVALDKSTGRKVWTARGGALHAQPAIVNVGDSQELVLNCHSTIKGLNPNTGKTLWTLRTKVTAGMPAPLVIGDTFYAMTRARTEAIRAGGRGDVTATQLKWTLRRGSHVATPVYFEGHLYFPHDEDGLFYCVNAKTGKLVYEERLQPYARNLYASPIVADGKIYLVSHRNGTYVFAAKPKFKQLAVNVIENDKARYNATPAVSRGQLLLRSDRYLYCIGKK